MTTGHMQAVVTWTSTALTLESIATVGTVTPGTTAFTSIPCNYVLVYPKVSATTGVAGNTYAVYIGIAGTGNQRVAIEPTHYAGVVVPCLNVNELYGLSRNVGDGVNIVPVLWT